jgi:hypothetical protein
MPVYDILYGINQRLVWPGILVLILMLLGAAAARLMPPIFGAAWVGRLTRGAVLALGALVAFQVVLAGDYFLYPGYIDWAEPMIAAASWIGWRGEHLYPLLDKGDVFGNWYGPVLFQITGFSLWLFGPSIAGSKVLAIAAFTATPFVSFRMLRQNGATPSEALVLTLVQILLQAGFTNQAIAFGVRGDPFLLMAAELGVWAATGRPTLARAAILGLLMGLSANLKIHGGFFILPIYAFFVSQADSTIKRVQLVAITAAAGLASLALPFAPENASLAPLCRPLRSCAAPRHIPMDISNTTSLFLAMCWSPVLWLYALFRPKLPRGSGWFAVACVPCMALVTAVGAVEGGGPYNLLAFLPSLTWALAIVLQAIRRQADAAAGNRLQLSCLGMLAAFLIGFAPNLAISWNSVLRKYADAPLQRQALAEINRQMRTHPGVTMEVGPGRYHDLRVVPVFRGNPLPIDSQTWADLKAGGIGEDSIRKSVETCRVGLWLMPAGEPVFQEQNYPGLYSPAFIQDFYRHYEKQTAGRIFDGWRCSQRATRLRRPAAWNATLLGH